MCMPAYGHRALESPKSHGCCRVSRQLKHPETLQPGKVVSACEVWRKGGLSRIIYDACAAFRNRQICIECLVNRLTLEG
jgi:hypothetical protein